MISSSGTSWLAGSYLLTLLPHGMSQGGRQGWGLSDVSSFNFNYYIKL